MAIGAPLASVIVTTYGRPAWLEVAVQSVLAQTVDDLEVVVVDDGSPEPVRLPPHPRVRVVARSTNGGVSAARNTGLDEVRGSVIAMLDDDDVFVPDRLERGIAALERATFGVCLAQRTSHRGPVPTYVERDASRSILNAYTPQIGTVTLPASRALRFDERIRGVEDVEWWLRLAQTGTFSMVDEVGVILRDHDLPRAHSTLRERIDGRRLMLADHRQYFDENPRARAFQLMRIAVTARQAGARAESARALAASIRAHPLRGAPRVAARLLWP